jgi:acetyltransferase-like isoleucine patch superfamily enzyme
MKNSNDKILLSICIPTYNRSKALDGNLKALSLQIIGKNLPLELIVSDNCSTDDTSLVVDKYIKLGLSINYIKNGVNLGMDGNFAQCYRKAKGKYVLVLGDDDYIIDGKLIKIIDYLKDSDYGLVHLKTDSNSNLSCEIFNDPELFLKNISYWITYITSNIVNSKYIKDYDFENYFGTYLTIVPLYLSSAVSNSENLLIHERIFKEGVESKSNGGYNFFEVFVTNYLRVWKDSIELGKINGKLYHWIKHDIFKFFLTNYIIELLIFKRTGNFKVKSAWKILFFEYGSTFYTYYYLFKLIIKKLLRFLFINRFNFKYKIYSLFIPIKLLKIGSNLSIDYPIYLVGGKSIIIGDNFTCYKRTRLEVVGNLSNRPKIVIGNNVCINWDCHLGALELIKIDNNVLIGSRVLITDHSHGDNTFSDLKLPPSKRALYSKGPVFIEENVWIGDGVAILPNVTIGKNSIIGANAVITKNVPPNSVVGGNPARILRILEL